MELGEIAPESRSLRVVLSPNQAVHVIALRQQQLGQVPAVLAGDAGDQRRLAGSLDGTALPVAIPHAVSPPLQRPRAPEFLRIVSTKGSLVLDFANQTCQLLGNCELPCKFPTCSFAR